MLAAIVILFIACCALPACRVPTLKLRRKRPAKPIGDARAQSFACTFSILLYNLITFFAFSVPPEAGSFASLARNAEIAKKTQSAQANKFLRAKHQSFIGRLFSK